MSDEGEFLPYEPLKLTLRARFRLWRKRRKMRRALNAVRRCFGTSVPHFEDAETIELLETDDGVMFIRLCMPHQEVR